MENEYAKFICVFESLPSQVFPLDIWQGLSSRCGKRANIYG